MADINVERKGPSAWRWLLPLLLVVLVAAAAWWFLGNRDADRTAADDVTTEAAPPAYDPATAPPYPAPAPDTGAPRDTTI